jgi:general secretion pathway protein J
VSFKFQVSSFKFKVQSPDSRDSRFWIRGFTLLELLVAGAILSLVLAALYGVFSRTLASKRLTEERVARSRAARIVLLRLGEELQAAVPPQAGTFRFTGAPRRTGAFPEDSVSFVSLAAVPLTSASPERELCEIAYALAPDPIAPTQRQLVRRVTRDLAADRGPDGEIDPLLAPVRGLRFRFFDGRNWREEWGRDNTEDRLPQAVEVVLYLEDTQSDTSRSDRLQPDDVAAFSTVIDLPLAATQRLVTP